MTNELHGPGTHAVGVAGRSAASLLATGLVRPYGPVTLARIGKALVTWGTGPAGGYASLAARNDHGIALHDERGSMTFGEVHRQANALAHGLAARGVGAGDAVALMARNHRWFVVAAVAIGRLGADVLYLNTAFSGPQTVELLEREKPRAVIYDEEFGAVVDAVPADVARIVAWEETADVDGADATVAELVASGDDTEPGKPAREGRSVILTSGTTGTPKGANRGSGSIGAGAALLSRLPLRFGMRTHIAAPMFHTWGWAHLNLSMLLGSTLVLRRRFDPRDFLRTLAEQRCDAAIVVPVMIQRAMELPDEELARYDLSALRVVGASGSALPGDLAIAWMDRFGDNLYNTYGSTECAWATIAQPADMRAHPGTAGAPPIGTTVALLDDDGRPSVGSTGRVFVSNAAQFEGYTNGETKEQRSGLMATGDVGTIRDGLLFVEGRDDEMIVSGGENVYPQEVEDCLARHPAVLEVAAVGVDDEQFGQRLVAWVATRPDASVSEEQLQEHVRTHLARYKVPRAVVFVEELPRNATGKVLKRHLRHDESESE
ncbi:fatty-acyl-CoA synthase [Mumia flava]|uniref:Fatty-acyl-CoA synthase n=1 Tax=Mumia flava TaxID=1348852 RepID=A0A0B2B625_9ACTN|nr:AMP-binding protein [Mumia flava]PJJ53826.1 fatty-acyl-CoA synthase [Mumia flava]